MTKRIVLLLMLALAAASIEAGAQKRVTQADPGRRLALVIGNDASRNHPDHSVIDARAIAGALREGGFEVQLRENHDRLDMLMDLTQFTSELGQGDVALFYYSGRAMQIGGQNYLIGNDQSDAGLDLADDLQVRLRSLAAGDVLREMQSSPADLKIIILDASRDNSAGSAQSGRGSVLWPMNAGDGTFIAYAAAPGRTAEDTRVGSNGLYTASLIAAIQQPALTLEQVFKRAGDAVVQASGGKQVPWTASGIKGEFYFRQGTQPQQPAPAPRTPPALQQPPPASGQTKVNPKDGQTYVWIQAGAFQMGCSQDDNECDEQEKPAHTVTISRGFWMGQTPVTVEAFQSFSHATGMAMPDGQNGGRYPAVNVTWNEASAYCRWFGGRLPTEAEWEYAAQGGVNSARYGPLDDIAWCKANSGGRTHEVGAKQPNSFKLYDMLGNVHQWVGDWYGADYYQPSAWQSTLTAFFMASFIFSSDVYRSFAPHDPTGPSSGQSRIVRGGSYTSDPRSVRVSYRGNYVPASRLDSAGFRCVQESF
jgi:formylglycine-generating enzyme required for sulfatase activity